MNNFVLSKFLAHFLYSFLTNNFLDPLIKNNLDFQDGVYFIFLLGGFLL